MKCLRGFSIFVISFFLFKAYSPGVPLVWMGAAAAGVTTEYGLHIVKFDTPYGEVFVNLPDNIAKGDDVSGKLTAQAAGKTEAERAKNLDLLNKFIIEAGNNGIKLINGWGKWKIPEADQTFFLLKDPAGKEVGRVQVPVLDEPPSYPADGYQCPEYVQAGLSLPVRGKFNGDFSDTQVRMDEVELQPLAESPRALIIKAPLDQIGPTSLEFSEGDYRGKCHCRNIYVQLAADNLHLKRGQTTGLAVTVRGLEGLEEGLPLKLDNLSPQLVRLKGPNSILIQPQDVQPGGIFIYHTTVTGISPGTFRIRASIPLTATKRADEVTYR
jgi:hypothetical protein